MDLIIADMWNGEISGYELDNARSTPVPVPAAPAATVAPSALVSGPILGVVAGHDDLLPPRFNGDRRVDADHWAEDFCAYVAVRRISPSDALLLLRMRLAGAARTWLEGVPVGTPWEDIIARFRQRFGADSWGILNRLS